jgi:hypothetical protein
MSTNQGVPLRLKFDPFPLAVAVLAVYALVTGSFAALAVAVLLSTFSFEVAFQVRR